MCVFYLLVYLPNFKNKGIASVFLTFQSIEYFSAFTVLKIITNPFSDVPWWIRGGDLPRCPWARDANGRLLQHWYPPSSPRVSPTSLIYLLFISLTILTFCFRAPNSSCSPQVLSCTGLANFNMVRASWNSRPENWKPKQKKKVCSHRLLEPSLWFLLFLTHASAFCEMIVRPPRSYSHFTYILWSLPVNTCLSYSLFLIG